MNILTNEKIHKYIKEKRSEDRKKNQNELSSLDEVSFYIEIKL